VKVALFSTKPYDQQFLQAANALHDHELVFFEPRLTPETSLLAAGFPAVCAFVNDQLQAAVLQALARLLTFPNVLISGHQGFFTREALQHIAEMTLANITAFERGGPCAHRVA
jgi:lactate dehydrogenase-like 2-hydroxyacid dehydrogenase